MAVTLMTGFEAQQGETDQVTLYGTAAYNTTTKRTGAASVRCNPASGVEGYASVSTLPETGFRHFGLYIASLPSVGRVICGQTVSGYNSLRLNSSGTLTYMTGTTALGSTAALSTGQWYWIGVRCVGDGTNKVVIQIDGADALTDDPTATVMHRFVGVAASEASAIDIYIDDIISDGAGFLAPSKVDLALPISDNTRTAVTAGAGGTTNLWDAVNNTPPAGVASGSETDTTNIEYPASLTEDYIANLETYTTLGIASGDTILAVQSVVQHGEDIATGTKTAQNSGALTNPTVAGATITFGADGGAHGASPTLWVTTFGALTTSPSVTLGTSPTIRTSRTSQTRVGCIDFMGMLVAWTPAAALAGRSFAVVI